MRDDRRSTARWIVGAYCGKVHGNDPDPVTLLDTFFTGTNRLGWSQATKQGPLWTVTTLSEPSVGRVIGDN